MVYTCRCGAVVKELVRVEVAGGITFGPGAVCRSCAPPLMVAAFRQKWPNPTVVDIEKESSS